MNDLPFIAGGDINPARFVSLATTANQTVNESNGGDTTVIGISTEAAKAAPQTGASTLAAESGDQVRVHMMGENCLLVIGAGGCTAGDLLVPDADGKGVTATTGQYAFARALETASAAEKAHVLVLPPVYAP